MPNVVELLDHDAADRPRTQRLPGPAGPRDVFFTYDPNGNLTSLTPPGRTAHGFESTKVNLEKVYDPPQASPPLATGRVITYDGQGRLASIAHGPSPTDSATRTFTLGYDALHRLTSITDPLPVPNVVELLDHDGADRPRTQRLPGPAGPRDVLFTYDPNGNLTSLTPPGRTAHGFELTKVDLEKVYDPPQTSPPLAIKETEYTYDLDRQLDLVRRPDADGIDPETIDPTYDSAGRLATVTLPGTQGSLAYGYSTTTGRLASITGPATGANRPVLTYGYAGFLPVTETWTCQAPGSCPAEMCQ